jgi:hypothetical protein
VEVRLARGIEVVAGVERVVAVEQEGGAVERVGAGLGEHVDLAAGIAAELGAVGVRLDAELTDRLGAKRGAGGAAGRSVGEVVLDRPVEQVDVRPRILAVDAHAEAVRDDRSAVAVRVGEDAGLEQREVGVVAAVQRQLFDRLRADQVAELAARRVDRGGVARDRDLFAQAPHFERDVQDHRLRDGQPDVTTDVRLEARQLGAHFVGAGRKPGNDIAAFRAGDRFAHQ